MRHTYERHDCAIGAAAFSGPREPFGGSGRGWGVTGHGVWQGHGDGGGGRPHTFFDGWSGGCCTPHVPRGPTNWHGSVHGCVRGGRILGHLHWANDEFDTGNEEMMCLQRTERGLVRALYFRGLQTAPRGRRGHTLQARFAHAHILRTGTLDAGEAGSRGGRRRARRASALLAEARGGTVPGGPRRAGGRRGAGRAADFCVGKSRRQGGRAGGGEP